VYTKVDLTGSNSASRTVDLDIDKVTDVYFVGQTYGYGIAPSGTGTPWFTGYATTINAGSATTIGKAVEVAAQNIAVNVSNQVLGGFATDFKGEAVSVTSLPITFATSTGMAGRITSISLVDSNGVVVAGPLDMAASAVTTDGVTFTDTVTFPTGRHVYTIKGKVGSAAQNNSTIIVTTDPTAWSGITGQTSGNTIALTPASFPMNTMTVKAASLTAVMSSQPTSQTIVSGGTGVLMGQVQLDASQSGEDIRMSSIPLTQTGVITELTSCQLYNGSTALNTGSNVPSALAATTESTTFTFDNTLVIPKGTVMTLGIKCNVTGTNTHVWSVSTAAMTATGVTSGSSVNVTETASSGGTLTIGDGSFTVTVDASSPSYTLAAAGTTGQTLGVIKLRASNEAISLTKLGLTLAGSASGSGATLSNAAGGSTNLGKDDLVQVYLYDGSTLVGTATFTGGSATTTATSTLSTAVTLAKDTDKLITVKADLAAIGTGQSGGIGDVIRVDPLNAEGSGLSSGTTIKSGATAGVAGVQMFKTYPTVANAGVSCTNTSSCNGTAQVLKKFSISANAAGPVGLNQVAVALATSSAIVTNLKLFAYTDSGYSTPANVSGTTGGQFGGTATFLAGGLDIAAPTVSFYQTTALQIPAGGTRYFTIYGDVAVSAATWSVNATVLGDAATSTAPDGYNATSTANRTSLVAGVATTTTGHDFVWSDNASTTAAIADIDWFNGYAVPGLSASGF